MKKKIIRPLKGIDVDSSLNRRDDNSIYMAKNLRINSEKDTELGAYTNIKGLKKILGNSSDFEILQTAKVGDNIILFTRKFGTDSLALIKENDIPKDNESFIELNQQGYYWQTGDTYHKIIQGEFGFLSSKKIDVKTYYESDDVQKVYWAVEGEPLRVLNIIYNSTTNIIDQYTPDDLLSSPVADLSVPEIQKTISGNLTCGKIYYAYSLVNNVGAETNLSELSKSYHLTKSPDYAQTDYEYKGYGFDVDSGKGISVKVENIPSNFSRLKMYSIHYIDDVSLPVVKLIYDNSVVNEVTISDTGAGLLELAAEEFIAVNNLTSTGGLLEIKNNYLFQANYKETFFDIDEFASGNYWDARAYRFPEGSNTVPLYESDLATVYNAYYLALAAVPKNHDAINLSNDNVTQSREDYYLPNSSTYGAKGLNIQVTQGTKYFLAPDNYQDTFRWASYTVDFLGYDSHAAPARASLRKVFKYDEVYRLGIQFKNGYGQLSFVKWICDYKYTLASNATSEMFESVPTSGNVELKLNHLTIDINNIPTDPITGQPFEYRIMYVPISDNDQGVYHGVLTRLAGTLAGPLVAVPPTFALDKDSGSSDTVCPFTRNKLTSFSNEYFEFVNADYCFGNKALYSKIKIVSASPDFDIFRRKSSAIGVTLYKIYNFSNDTAVVTRNVQNQYDIEYDIDIGGKVPLYGGSQFARKGYARFYPQNGHYRKNCESSDKDNYGRSNKGRCQILRTSDIANYGDSVMMGLAYVDNFQSKYGGLSYEVRNSNSYVALSDFETGDIDRLYGDTFIGLFEHLRQISDNDTPEISNNQDYGTYGTSREIGYETSEDYLPGHPEIYIFPTYSRINLNLRSDDFFTRLYTKTAAYNIHEYSGVYQDTLGHPDLDDRPYISNTDDSGAPFTQETDLYLYNKTYSREQDLFQYFEKPLISSLETEFKTRIIASSKKILGEQTDSFLKLNPLSYIDVDGQYGEIKRLIVFNDRLYFFQNNAIGVAAVNEKATTNISDGSQLSLGQVGLLSRYDYLTTQNGIVDRNHVMENQNGLYFIDAVRNEICKISSKGLEKISISSHVNSLVNNVDFTNSFIVSNRKYNEVLFLYNDNDNPTITTALVFNELSQQFNAVYTYNSFVKSSSEINREDLFDELVVDANSDIYSLNDGDYNKLGENDFYPSEITFLIPNKEENIVMFNVLEFIANQVDSNDNSVDFIDAIRIYTKNYEQDTDWLDFNTLTKRKFGKYRTNKIRDYSGAKKERIISDHIYVHIKTNDNNGTNYRVFFRDLIASIIEYNYFG